jgi:hypothetical protein
MSKREGCQTENHVPPSPVEGDESMTPADVDPLTSKSVTLSN